MSKVQEQATLAFRRSYEIFAEHCLKVQNKKAQLVAFVFNRVQRALWLMLLEDLQSGKPIRWHILKARQMGVSTWIAGLFYWLTSLRSNRGCLVVAHDTDSAAGLFEKQKIFYKASPETVRPQQKLNNRLMLHFANPDNTGPIGLESRIVVDTAKNKHLGASFTIQAVHLSEYARYEEINPEIAATMVSLNQAIPELPGTFIFKETTAQGEGRQKDEWDDEDNTERKIFLSFVAEDEYRLEISPSEYFALSDIEDGLYGNEEEAADSIRKQIDVWYPEFKPNTPDNAKRIEHEIMCRLAWRRWYIVNKCERDKNAFRQEYPLTPEEAFTATGKSVFDARYLSDVRKVIVAEQKKNEGLGIIYPDNFRYASTAYSRENRNWWKQSFYPAGYGPLSVYEWPIVGRSYAIGADVGEGIDDTTDRSSAVVLRVPEMIQVARYNGLLDPDEYGYLLYALGYLYNTALLGVETNSIGKATVLKLQRLHYPRLYKREMIGHADTQRRQAKYGWHTNENTKPTLVSDLMGAFRNDSLQLTDLATVNQLLTYKKLPNGEYGAAGGKKDDLVIALGIALQMARQIYFSAVPSGKQFPKGSVGWELQRIDATLARQRQRL